MVTFEETRFSDIKTIIKKYDIEAQIAEYDPKDDTKLLVKAIDDYFSADRYVNRAVLGIDIYRYSKYPETKQFMIPFIFKELYDMAVRVCKEHEPFIFQNITVDDFQKTFVSTGDGGFQIFPTPLHAFLFACYFESTLRSFNSYSIFPSLRHLLGPLSLRYALTMDKLYHFENNYFGAAIINNARILSRDSLNRFLLDHKAHDWFLHKVAGLETLRLVTLESIAQLQDFNDYDKSFISGDNFLVSSEKRRTSSNIKYVSIQKIGLVEPKGTSLDVYSLYAQIALWFYDEDDPEHKQKPMIVALGNTNSSGI